MTPTDDPEDPKFWLWVHERTYKSTGDPIYLMLAFLAAREANSYPDSIVDAIAEAFKGYLASEA